MNEIGRINKKLRIGYIFICIAAAILYLTGYSFTLEFLDYVIIGIIILYPVIEFIRSSLQPWIKLVMGIATAILALFIFKTIVFINAFGETSHTLSKWNVDGYQIVLTQRQGWSGPSYKRYDLIKYQLYGLISKPIAYGFPDSTNSCEIKFDNDIKTRIAPYEFNRCTNVLKENKPTTNRY